MYIIFKSIIYDNDYEKYDRSGKFCYSTRGLVVCVNVCCCWFDNEEMKVCQEKQIDKDIPQYENHF